MRLVAFAALQAVGWSIAAPGHAAPATVAGAVAPLAPGEVLLELEETGSVTTAGDLARVVIPVTATRPTGPEARKAAAAQAARIGDAVRSAGVAPQDLTVEEGSQALGFVGNEGLVTSDDLQPAPGVPSPRTAAFTIMLRLRDPAAFDRIRAAAESAGAANVPRPVFTLSDEGPAREAAKADAVRKARAEAESYARTLGMRVARVLRVSERGNTDFGVQQARIIMRMVGGGAPLPAGKVETSVLLDIDFALAPTR